MLVENQNALEKIVSDIEIRVLCVDILADSIQERKKNCCDISFLILDVLCEIRQYLSDIDTLISCEKKGVIIDV